MRLVSPEKDVDGFHPLNVGKLVRMGEEIRQDMDEDFDSYSFTNSPCTPLGCIELLDRAGIEIKGKRAVIIGRSNIVGLPMSIMLLHRDATVSICHSRSPDIKEISREADILIVACGKPRLVRKDWVKPGAAVIDVGMSYVEDDEGAVRPVGDVDFEEVSQVAGYITKVPGGVGPMTIAMLMQVIKFIYFA